MVDAGEGPEKRRETWRRWYHRTKNSKRQRERRSASRKRRNARNREWYKKFRRTLSCAACSESDPDCLHLHHRDEKKKRFAISTSLAKGWTLPSILREVKGCRVLCANCHLLIHARRWRRKRRRQFRLRERSRSLVEAFLEGRFDGADS